jgi:scyllo-inositol 2-dehydrogenase (NAD+)
MEFVRKKINVGVIGLGRLGSLYADYFGGRIEHANLLAVSDIRETQAESFARAHQVPKWYKHYQELVADKDIEAVVIVTPTNTHKEVVIESASHGKAVLCEKPLSLSIEEAEEMNRAIGQKGTFFQMGFMRRFDKGYAAAKRKIEAGLIGNPILFKSTSRDPFRPSLEYLNPQNSGGLIVDCGIHDIDLACWYMGKVRSVCSIGGVLAYPEMNEIGDVDNAVTTLRFSSGGLGVIDLSRNAVYGYDIHTEILGTKGALRIGYLRQTPVTVLTKEGVAHDTVPYFKERFEQAYIDQLQDFVENVLQSRTPPITCADGLAALQIGLAATQSLKEGCPVQVADPS